MVGLHYLKHCYGLSDEAVVSGWVENPYWQYVCGAVYFQHEVPVDPSSLTRFRRRIGESGCARILQVTVALGVQSKAVKTTDFKRVTVDTTVQEISGELSDRQQVAESVPGAVGTVMSQTGGGVTPEHCPQGAAGVAAGEPLRSCQTVSAAAARGEAVTHLPLLNAIQGQALGRVVRDSERNTAGNPAQQRIFADELALAKRLLAQQKQDKHKLYSLHAPEVECISKGKVAKRYEFGVKASIATTNKSNFVVGGMALPGSPYDGHTLKQALEQVRRLTGTSIDEAFVDRGYRGHDETESTVYISGQKRGIKTQRLKQSLKRRQAIEPVIGHLKADGLLGRNHLNGTDGDQLNVLLSCAGHNLRLILRRLRFFCLKKRILILAWLRLWSAPRCLSWLPATSMAA